MTNTYDDMKNKNWWHDKHTYDDMKNKNWWLDKRTYNDMKNKIGDLTNIS